MSQNTEADFRCGHCEDSLSGAVTTSYCLKCSSYVCTHCVDDGTYSESSTDDSRNYYHEQLEQHNSSKCRVGGYADLKRLEHVQVETDAGRAPSSEEANTVDELGDDLNVFTERVCEKVCYIRDTINISENGSSNCSLGNEENTTLDQQSASLDTNKKVQPHTVTTNAEILLTNTGKNMPAKIEVDLLGTSAKIDDSGFISVTVPLEKLSKTESRTNISDTKQLLVDDFCKAQLDNELESGYGGSQCLILSSSEMLTNGVMDSNQNLIDQFDKNVAECIADSEHISGNNRNHDSNGNTLTHAKPAFSDLRGKSASFDESEIAASPKVIKRIKKSSSDTRFVRGHSRSSSLPDLLKSTIDRKSAIIASNDQLSKSTVDLLDNDIKSGKPIQMCDKNHKDTPTYICLKDNEIYCKVCVHIHNLHCKEKVKYIPEIPPETRTKACDDAMRELLSARERFTHVKDELCGDLEELKDSRNVYVRAVMRFKQNLIDLIDQIEKDAMSDMDLIYSIECDKIQKNLAKLESNISTLDTFLHEIKVRECNEDNSIFYQIPNASKSVENCELDLHDIHKSCFKTDFSFKPLETIKSLCSEGEQLWTIKLTKDVKCQAPYPCTCDRSFKYRKAELDKHFSAKLSRWSFDRDKCYISGCEFLENGNLLLADNHNKKIKMFDKKYKCMSALHLSSLPWDLAVIDRQLAVVTIPDKKQLQFFEANSKLTLKHSVHLEKNCWGVARAGELLVVSCWSRDTSEILVMDTDGLVRRTIRAASRTPFSIPWYVSVFGDVIRVSDWGSNAVTFMTITGNTLSQYSDNSLKGTMGLKSDPEGNVYVCGRDTNTIHQVSTDGRKVQAILTERDGIDKPLCVCHCPLDNRFVVTSWMSDTVQVFRLV